MPLTFPSTFCCLLLEVPIMFQVLNKTAKQKQRALSPSYKAAQLPVCQLLLRAGTEELTTPPTVLGDCLRALSTQLMLSWHITSRLSMQSNQASKTSYNVYQ